MLARIYALDVRFTIRDNLAADTNKSLNAFENELRSCSVTTFLNDERKVAASMKASVDVRINSPGTTDAQRACLQKIKTDIDVRVNSSAHAQNFSKCLNDSTVNAKAESMMEVLGQNNNLRGDLTCALLACSNDICLAESNVKFSTLDVAESAVNAAGKLNTIKALVRKYVKASEDCKRLNTVAQMTSQINAAIAKC